MEEHEEYKVTMDAGGHALSGEKYYIFHLPPNIPAKAFWSVLSYDAQSSLIIRSSQPWPSVFKTSKGLAVNQDSSIDIRFGPTIHAASSQNWIKTIPGNGWTMILRLYGALDTWFDKTWRPGKLEEFRI